MFNNSLKKYSKYIKYKKKYIYLKNQIGGFVIGEYIKTTNADIINYINENGFRNIFIITIVGHFIVTVEPVDYVKKYYINKTEIETLNISDDDKNILQKDFKNVREQEKIEQERIIIEQERIRIEQKRIIIEQEIKIEKDKQIRDDNKIIYFYVQYTIEMSINKLQTGYLNICKALFFSKDGFNFGCHCHLLSEVENIFINYKYGEYIIPENIHIFTSTILIFSNSFKSHCKNRNININVVTVDSNNLITFDNNNYTLSIGELPYIKIKDNMYSKASAPGYYKKKGDGTFVEYENI